MCLQEKCSTVKKRGVGLHVCDWNRRLPMLSHRVAPSPTLFSFWPAGKSKICKGEYEDHINQPIVARPILSVRGETSIQGHCVNFTVFSQVMVFLLEVKLANFALELLQL